MEQRLHGRVTSGIGDLARWMRAYREAYRRATGADLVPGSLNVVLDEEWRLSPGTGLRLDADEIGVGMTLVPCTVAGRPAFIARTDRNEAGTGHHPRRVVEVVADTHLRAALGLRDGDEVEVVVGQPPAETDRHS